LWGRKRSTLGGTVRGGNERTLPAVTERKGGEKKKDSRPCRKEKDEG